MQLGRWWLKKKKKNTAAASLHLQPCVPRPDIHMHIHTCLHIFPFTSPRRPFLDWMDGCKFHTWRCHQFQLPSVSFSPFAFPAGRGRGLRNVPSAGSGMTASRGVDWYPSVRRRRAAVERPSSSTPRTCPRRAHMVGVRSPCAWRRTVNTMHTRR